MMPIQDPRFYRLYHSQQYNWQQSSQNKIPLLSQLNCAEQRYDNQTAAECASQVPFMRNGRPFFYSYLRKNNGTYAENDGKQPTWNGNGNEKHG